MSRMHAPETNRLSEHQNEKGTQTTTCPACGAEMPTAALPNHIGTHEVGSDE